MTINKIEGSCLCGAVTFECVNDFKEFHFCHCHQCQKISGSAHVANLFSTPGSVTWASGLSSIQRYDIPDRALSNAFCKHCGSPVPYHSKAESAMVVPAGILDGEPNIRPQDNIFWHERACWYDEGIKSKKSSAFPK